MPTPPSSPPPTSKSKTPAEKEKDDTKSSTTSHSAAPPTESETTTNYLILATLTGITNPSITRLLSLPPSLTFADLHRALQIAFGWANSHMLDFNVSLLDPNDNEAMPRFCLSISPDPSIFAGDMMNDTKAESEITLADVYEKPEWKDRAEIEYEYDHGDGWNHHLALLGRATPGTNAHFGAPSDVKVLCLNGQGHPAAEDVGGECGWEGLKDAFKHPRKGENRERIEWYKHVCLNGDGKLDPYAFDVMDVNDGLRDAFAEGKSGGMSNAACGGCGKGL